MFHGLGTPQQQPRNHPSNQYAQRLQQTPQNPVSNNAFNPNFMPQQAVSAQHAVQQQQQQVQHNGVQHNGMNPMGNGPVMQHPHSQHPQHPQMQQNVQQTVQQNMQQNAASMQQQNASNMGSSNMQSSNMQNAANMQHNTPNMQQAQVSSNGLQSNIQSNHQNSHQVQSNQSNQNITPSSDLGSSASPAIDPSLENHDHRIMTLPPEASYPTFDALFASAQAHARDEGYALVIGRSKRKKCGLKKALLCCDRSGTNRERIPLAEKKRRTTSRKTNCEFSFYANEEKGEWLLRWRAEGPDEEGVERGKGRYARHNHAPSDNPLEHPRHRRMAETTVAAVKAMQDAGLSARETLDILQAENPSALFKARDIYNARSGLTSGRIQVDPETLSSTPQRTVLSSDEKLRNELRKEIFDVKAELEDTKNKLEAARKQIKKYEMFIDICNQRIVIASDNAEAQGMSLFD